MLAQTTRAAGILADHTAAELSARIQYSDPDLAAVEFYATGGRNRRSDRPMLAPCRPDDCHWCDGLTDEYVRGGY